MQSLNQVFSVLMLTWGASSVPYSFPAPCEDGYWRRGAPDFVPHTVSAPSPAPPRSPDSSAGTPAAPPETPQH